MAAPFDFGPYSTAQNEEGDCTKLTWRDDPDRSLSDWQIVVKNTGSGASTTYHVHKVMLAAGAQSSDYFKTIFRGAGAGMSEGASQTSLLELEDSAANAFPVFLDFAYSGELKAETHIAAALFHLARYLRCSSLFASVAAWMQLDLKESTAARYLAEAELYGLEKVSAHALPLCAKSLGPHPSDELDALAPDLFRRVVESPERSCTSEQLSVLVAKYCRGPHADLVDGPFLAAVASAKLMPTVDPSAALALLELALKPTFDGHGCLQARASVACASHWRLALLPALSSGGCSPLSAISSKSSATNAGFSLISPPKEGAEPQAKKQRGSIPTAAVLFSAAISDAVKVRLLAAALNVAEAQLKQAEEDAKAKAAEIEKHKTELRRFKRIPVNDTTLGSAIDVARLNQVTYSASTETITLRGHSGVAYSYSGYYGAETQRKYGDKPPSCLPSGDSCRDGWVRNTSMGYSTTVYPIYYFQ